MRTYFLRKSKKILFHTYELFKRKRKKLPAHEVNEMEQTLNALQLAIMEKNREKASEEAKKCERFCRTYLKKGPFENVRDLVLALAFALIVALLIRQTWFELYEIPSGSMRPTFKEKDRLVVSKTDFGINFPFTPGHFYFDPELLKRAGTFVFTVENMDVRDPDTLYFYLFPGKKQFVKRLLGKAGDILYFYGGNIYGIDKEGHMISAELQPERLSQIDHIPFIRFDGNTELSDPLALPNGTLYRSATIYQMNQPIARLRMLGDSRFAGEMLPHTTIAPSSYQVEDFGDLWGIKNYATTRLLTKEQIKTFYSKEQLPAEEALAYLELKHHPSLKALKLGKDPYGRIRPSFKLSTSFIPLNEEHLKRLFSHLYTSRFHVKNGVAYSHRLNQEGGAGSPLAGVPDGTYEFYYGKAYELPFDGVSKEVPSDHPLYQFSLDRLQFLFNFGIDFEPRYFSDFSGELFITSRYSYFRGGDLYVMGAPLLFKNDPALASFIESETKGSTPFLDEGEPDLEKIKKYGLKIPEKSYLALGDNYANSSDSRDFGFVPQDNIRGGPYFIFWPPGSRFGHPNQAPYATFVFPRMVVWGVAAICFGAWYLYHRKRTKLPLKL
ncbi:MAG TPA: S26 family signal peptidase [Rhabdochlamydiaceae bacterium]|nr:S26 family signal peptidase [Rhabdochlamydiaceae bacterium]